MLLSEYPEEKRREFVGMWAEFVDSAKEEDLVVIVDVFSDRAVAVAPAFGGCDGLYSLNELALRPDLPRAWTQRGNPIDVKPEKVVSYTTTNTDRKKTWLIDSPAKGSRTSISLNGEIDKIILVQSSIGDVDIVSLTRQEAMLAASVLRSAARTNL